MLSEEAHKETRKDKLIWVPQKWDLAVLSSKLETNWNIMIFFMHTGATLSSH